MHGVCVFVCVSVREACLQYRLCNILEKVIKVGARNNFFFFLFTQARPQSQRGELWGCLVVGLDTLGRPVVSASSCV